MSPSLSPSPSSLKFFFLSIPLPFRREQVFAEGRLKLQVCGISWRENEIGGLEGRIRTGWEKGKLAVVAGQQRASEPYPLHQVST